MTIDDIKSAPWNTRATITDESVRSLAESIKADGLIQPIGICDAPDGDGYVCFDGNRRLAACRLLGMKDIPAHYYEITEEEARIRTVVANLQREDDDPLLAAAVISGLSGDAEQIASKLGKTTAWVKRRAKLNKLTDEMKALGGKVTLNLLERVSDLSPENQKKLAKSITNRLEYANGNLIEWSDIRYEVDRLTMDLDCATFDTSACAQCLERSGAEWFTEDESGLGRCLNCACFKAKIKAHEDAQIADKIGKAESVRVEYEWQMPYETRNTASDKKTKANKCAYYWFEKGQIKVKWARSKDEIDAERKAADAVAEAERKAKEAERAKDEEVNDAMREVCDGSDCAAEVSRVLNALVADTASEEARRYIVEAVIAQLGGFQYDYAEILRAFPEFVEIGKIDVAAIEEYLERHPIEDDDAE